MQEIDNLLMQDNKCDHSLILLKKLITSIESFPSLYEYKKLEGSFENKTIIIEYLREYKRHLNNSNIKKIKKILFDIEYTLKMIYKTKYNEVIKNKIKIINNSVIERLYNEDIKLLEDKLRKQKEELKKELNKLDKELNCFITISKKDNKIIIDEDLENQTNIKEIFNKISIEELIKNIDLEEIQILYFKELYGNPFEEEDIELFTYTEDKNLIRLNIYPILKVLKKITKYYPKKYDELEKQSIKVASLAIKAAQLENLNKFINFHGLLKTSNYINKSLNSINKIIDENTKIISNVIKTIIPNIKNVYMLNEQEKQITIDILTELLLITKSEAEMKYRYHEYDEFIDETISDYQKFLLNTKYNINFSIDDILNEIEKRKIQKTIADAPKTKIIKKLRKIKVLTYKKRK